MFHGLIPFQPSQQKLISSWNFISFFFWLECEDLGEWMKEIYWVVKNIWCRSCLVFTSWLINTVAVFHTSFLLITVTGRVEFPSSAFSNKKVKTKQYFDVETSAFQWRWNYLPLPIHFEIWSLGPGRGPQWYWGGSVVREEMNVGIHLSQWGRWAKTSHSMECREAFSQCSWLFLPHVNSEKLFEKLVGRNVYALSIGSQKLKKSKVTQLKSLQGIDVLFGTTSLIYQVLL